MESRNGLFNAENLIKMLSKMGIMRNLIFLIGFLFFMSALVTLFS